MEGPGLYHVRIPSRPVHLPVNDAWYDGADAWSSDNPGARSLTGSAFTDTEKMTVESCVNFCAQGGFIFAGLEFSQVCVILFGRQTFF